MPGRVLNKADKSLYSTLTLCVCVFFIFFFLLCFTFICFVLRFFSLNNQAFRSSLLGIVCQKLAIYTTTNTTVLSARFSVAIITYSDIIRLG